LDVADETWPTDGDNNNNNDDDTTKDVIDDEWLDHREGANRQGGGEEARKS
jgi:hypothetical protein